MGSPITLATSVSTKTFNHILSCRGRPCTNAWGAPYYYWVVGSSDNPNAPYNHSPKFAPDLDPVLDLSTRAILAGISPWLMQN